MLNQIVLVGRIVKIEERETSTETTLSVVTISVPRSYKNINGEYDIDFIEVTLWNNIAKNTMEYCHKGDLIGIRGRIECNKELRIVADKITFLSNKISQEDNN